MPNIPDRLKLIRRQMLLKRLDALIINGTDPHASEYVAARWRTREWVSGFTGSAGTVVVTQTLALLWVDSRYFIQAAREVADTSFILQRLESPGIADHIQWLAANMPPGSRVGVDASTLTVSASRLLRNGFKKNKLVLVPTDDMFEAVWDDRPPVPSGAVVAMDTALAGESRASKLDRIRRACQKTGCTHTVVSSLDDIAWILNLRGSDVPYNPVFLSYLLIGPESATLFADRRRFDDRLFGSLSHDVSIRPYHDVFTCLPEILPAEGVLYLSPEKTNMRIFNSVPQGMDRVEGRDFSTDFKAIKSSVELEGMRRAHVLDGIAMVRLLAKLSKRERVYTELSIARELEELRRTSEEYLGPSFAPIAGFGPHGVLNHYSASEETSVELAGNGLLVLDTGGQYRTGMTDITRTLLFGEASVGMREDYTLVLKGNIALGTQRFPAGTCGYQLDALARQFLWQSGLSYGHGTGHGVGFRLNVHEGPQNISPKPVTVPLQAGMVVSDEPGVYREGSHGVRIENLVAVRSEGSGSFGEFLSFEVLTICPFEKALIDTGLLTEAERMTIDAYHAWVYEKLSGRLSAEDRDWLRKATLPL